MKITNQTFAFRLAKRDDSPSGQWKARDGAPIAGCSGPDYRGNYRDYRAPYPGDNGIYC